MSKIKIEEVVEIIHRNKVAPEVANVIIDELNALASEKDDNPKPDVPASKKQFVIMVSDPSGRTPEGLTGWVLQIPESAAPHTAVERTNKAAHAFNRSKKGRLLPVKTVGEAFEAIPRKFFKTEDVHTKTKVPVTVLVTNNKLSPTPSVD